MKTEIIQLSMAYFGTYFLMMWCVWGYAKYGVVGADIGGFLFECLKVLSIA